MFEYCIDCGSAFPGGNGRAAHAAVGFEPTRWQYCYRVDGVEKRCQPSAANLEEYMHAHILQAARHERHHLHHAAEKYARGRPVCIVNKSSPDGNEERESARAAHSPPKAYKRGRWASIIPLPGDYVSLHADILPHGRAARTGFSKPNVGMMSTNPDCELGAGSAQEFSGPQLSADRRAPPGVVDKLGLGVLINTKAYDNGVSERKPAWAGIDNTFYWIDPNSEICANILCSSCPSLTREAPDCLGDF